MARVPRKTKTKAAVEAVVEAPVRNGDAVAEAAAEAAVAKPAPELQPPSTPVEPVMDDVQTGDRHGYQRDKIAASLNIAKLQAMQMSELNAMAKCKCPPGRAGN